MVVVTVSPRGQILVPRDLRRRVGLLPGKRVRLVEEAGSLRVTPLPDDPVRAARGCLGIPARLSDDIVKEHADEREPDRRRRAE